MSFPLLNLPLSGQKRNSPDPDPDPEPEPAPEANQNPRPPLKIFYNVELDDNDMPTQKYSYSNESEAGEAWIKFQFFSRKPSDRHAFANATVEGADYEPPGYKGGQFASWPDSAAKSHYETQLLKFFNEMGVGPDNDPQDPEEDYQTLLEAGKVSLADIAEDRLYRHMQRQHPATGNQEDWALFGSLEDPDFFRKQLLADWSPFYPSPNYEGQSRGFPTPTYIISGDDTMASLIAALHRSPASPARGDSQETVVEDDDMDE